MKSYQKIVAFVATLGVSALVAHAQAPRTDLLVGFAQAGAANDVIIDMGAVTSLTAPGTYNLGNYASILSSTFTNWNTSTGNSSVYFGAAAGIGTNGNIGKANPVWITSTVNPVTNTSTPWALAGYSPVNGVRTNLGNVDNVFTGTPAQFTVATPSSSNAVNSWTGQVAPTTATSFGYISAAQFNTATSALASNGTANFAAADLYSVAYGVPTAGSVVSLVGQLQVFQNGDVAFTVIPEPSTYAAILGLATLGFAAIRRRNQFVAQV